MSGMIVVAQALAVVLNRNEKPTILKKESLYHHLFKTGINFYQRGIKCMLESHSVLSGRRFSVCTVGLLKGIACFLLPRRENKPLL